MIERKDIKSYIRELFYIQEDALLIVDKTSLKTKERAIIKDNLTEKQIILTKLLRIVSDL